MRSFVKALLCILMAGTALPISSVPSVSGNVFQDVWGVVTDPLKLRASSNTLADSIERALLQLDQLRDKTHYNVQQRLEQIRSISQEVIDRGQVAVADALTRMAALERQVNLDAFALIARAECAAENVNGRLQDAFSEFLKQLAKADPTVTTVGGYKLAEFTVKPVFIQNPNEVYSASKDAANVALGKLTANSEARAIFWTHQNLKMLAKWARCRYDDGSPTATAAQIAFTREMNDQERLSLPWITVVDVHPL